MKCCYNCRFYNNLKRFCSILKENIKPFKVCYFYKGYKEDICLNCVYFSELHYCNYGSIKIINKIIEVDKLNSCENFKKVNLDFKVSPLAKKVYLRCGLTLPSKGWDYKNPEVSNVKWLLSKMCKRINNVK